MPSFSVLLRFPTPVTTPNVGKKLSLLLLVFLCPLSVGREKPFYYRLYGDPREFKITSWNDRPSPLMASITFEPLEGGTPVELLVPPKHFESVKKLLTEFENADSKDLFLAKQTYTKQQQLLGSPICYAPDYIHLRRSSGILTGFNIPYKYYDLGNDVFQEYSDKRTYMLGELDRYLITFRPSLAKGFGTKNHTYVYWQDSLIEVRVVERNDDVARITLVEQEYQVQKNRRQSIFLFEVPIPFLSVISVTDIFELEMQSNKEGEPPILTPTVDFVKSLKKATQVHYVVRAEGYQGNWRMLLPNELLANCRMVAGALQM